MTLDEAQIELDYLSIDLEDVLGRLPFDERMSEWGRFIATVGYELAMLGGPEESEK